MAKKKRVKIESMTVGELINLLEEFPKDLKVVGLDDMREPEPLSSWNFRRTPIWQHNVENKEQEVVAIFLPHEGWYDYDNDGDY